MKDNILLFVALFGLMTMSRVLAGKEPQFLDNLRKKVDEMRVIFGGREEIYGKSDDA